jgi:hypothetical protein
MLQPCVTVCEGGTARPLPKLGNSQIACSIRALAPVGSSPLFCLNLRLFSALFLAKVRHYPCQTPDIRCQRRIRSRVFFDTFPQIGKSLHLRGGGACQLDFLQIDRGVWS